MFTNKSFASSQIYTPRSVVTSDEFKRKAPKDIVFIHAPKTGGTNIDYLAKAVSADQSALTRIRNQRFSVPRRTGVSPNLFMEGATGGYPSAEEIRALNTTTAEDVQSRFFSGHMPTGLVKEALPGAQYISLVRDPIERAVSSINFDYQRGYISEEQVQHYAQSTMVDNLQTRLIAGKECMSGPCTEETYQTAVKNINNEFLFVAPTEEVDSVMSVLGNLYGYPRLAHARLQVTGEKLYEYSQVPELLHSALVSRNGFDRQLHQFAKEQWTAFCEENVTFQNRTYDNDQAIFTLCPDILDTKHAKYLTQAEIRQHNRDALLSGPLVEVTQTRK